MTRNTDPLGDTDPAPNVSDGVPSSEDFQPVGDDSEDEESEEEVFDDSADEEPAKKKGRRKKGEGKVSESVCSCFLMYTKGECTNETESMLLLITTAVI